MNLQDATAGMEVPIEYIIRPTVSVLNIVIAVVLSIVVPSLAAMIPARYTWKYLPADALRK